MSRTRARLLLAVILLAGAAFRLQHLNWDAHHHLHPDERFISMVEEKLVNPKSFSEYLDSSRSGLNPYNRGHGSFVYGTLPLLLARYVGVIVHKGGYDETFLVGRVVSAFFDLLSVFLVYRIARRLGSRGTSLVAAAFLAFAPLAIQLSHFWAVDTFLTAFSAAALYGAVRLAQGKSSLRDAIGTGLAVGLAVSCKITGLVLFLPVGAALVIGALVHGLPAAEQRPRWLVTRLLSAAALAATAVVTIRLAFPYAFLGRSVFSFQLDPRWRADLRGLTGIATTVAAFPPNFQWAGRTILFPLRNIVLWGAGPFFGLAAMAALVWGIAALRQRKALVLLPLLLHVLFLLLYHGLTMAKSMRYVYPTYPPMAVLASLLLARLAAGREGAPASRVRRILPAAAAAGTFLCSLAFSSVYSHEHTRVTASRWIYQNVPPGKLFVNESWDDGLPLPMEGKDSGQYGGPQPNLVGPDNAAKVEEIVKALEAADGVAITSNRGYASLTRIPDVFPMTRAYYSALFEERLGFRCAADFTSYPKLGPIVIPDDSSEEAFTVYDHPRVVLFRKTPEFSGRRARAILLAAIPETPPTLNAWETWPRSRKRVTSPLTPPRHAGLAAKSARAPDSPNSPGSRRDAPDRIRAERPFSGTSRCSPSAPPPSRSRTSSSRDCPTAASDSPASSGSPSRRTCSCSPSRCAPLSNGRGTALLLRGRPGRGGSGRLCRPAPAHPRVSRGEPPAADPVRSGLRVRLPALPRVSGAHSRDLLGREADGLLDPEHLSSAHPPCRPPTPGLPALPCATTPSGSRRWRG